MADPSPFVLSPGQKAAQARSFAAAHQRALGPVRGAMAFAGTLARFVRIRVGIGRTPAPMVDDAVAMAVAMYRTLSTSLGPDAALSAVRNEVVATGAGLMEGWLPTDRTVTGLGQQVQIVMGDAVSRDIYEIEGMATTDTGIALDVTACRYAELTRSLGAPEVGSVFCAVDQPFVSGALPELPFSCATTIAGGDDRCRFRLGDRA